MLKPELLWKRFEKTGSLQAYLRFRRALQGNAVVEAASDGKIGSAKRNVSKSKTLTKTR